MKNWKTTVVGLGGALCLIGYGIFTGHLDAKMIMEAMALFGLGAAAKDNDVTGGKRENSDRNNTL